MPNKSRDDWPAPVEGSPRAPRAEGERAVDRAQGQIARDHGVDREKDMTSRYGSRHTKRGRAYRSRYRRD